MKILVNVKLSPHKYKTPEGYLICQDAILARTGKQQYMKSELFPDCVDDEIIDVDRKPSEVFSEATMSSFEGKPITVEHPDVSVGPENYNELAVGHVYNIHRGNCEGQEVMLGDLMITDKNVIDDIENGIRTDLSCGYDCDITDGPNYCQTNIRGNHVALCEQGRAGIARVVDSKSKWVKPITDAISKGSLIQEFGKQGKQYKISKIVGNVIYAENLVDGKTVLFKKDEENIEWAPITKSEVRDSHSIPSTINKLEFRWDKADVRYQYIGSTLESDSKGYIFEYRIDYNKGEALKIARELFEDVNFNGDKLTVSSKDIKVNDALEKDFFGTKEGTEEADDLLFGLQVEFGKPNYNYDDFRKMDIDKHHLELAKKHAKELDKFHYFEDERTTNQKLLYEKKPHYTIKLQHYHLVKSWDDVHNYAGPRDSEYDKYVYDTLEEAIKDAKELFNKYKDDKIIKPNEYAYYAVTVIKWSKAGGNYVNEKDEDIGIMDTYSSYNKNEIMEPLKSALRIDDSVKDAGNIKEEIVQAIKSILGENINIDYGSRGIGNIVIRFKEEIKSPYMQNASLQGVIIALTKLGIDVDEQKSTVNRYMMEISTNVSSSKELTDSLDVNEELINIKSLLNNKYKEVEEVSDSIKITFESKKQQKDAAKILNDKKYDIELFTDDDEFSIKVYDKLVNDSKKSNVNDEYSRKFYVKAKETLQNKLKELDRKETLDENQLAYEKHKNKLKKLLNSQINEYDKKIEEIDKED